MSDYWLARDGQQYGPFSIEEIRQQAAQGQTQPSDLVWTEGMAEWEPLAKVAGTRPVAPPPPPTPSPLVATPSPKPVPSYVAPPAVAVADTTLQPPSMAWWLVLILCMLTCGIFAWVWCLKEASFAKKLDPRTNAWMLMLIAVIGYVLAIPFYIGVIVVDDTSVKVILGIIELLCYMAGAILYVVGAFQIRNVMVNHYTTVEPIGLKMSGAMTFFFHIFYIQYHYERIAKWKRTGSLQPQA